ncbi:pentatricopeptide repeat-containing protein At4g32450, mitochondrial-like [Euphorbia lathyris]|uniref:pentatricopeptide repeat-containing protein At4g32450, mitochondrial-like n=1 Tax=Euphorbia lathyris TaxID=212925 RepID=UPI0033138AC5
MSKKRASLLTLNSLTALSKVRSSSNAIITLAFSKNLSSAAQRSNFENSVGYQVDNSDENFRNPNFSYAENQNPIGLVQNPNGKGLNPDWGFRETNGNVVGDNRIAHSGNSGGSYGQNYGDYQNSSGDYWKNSREVYQNIPAERNSNININGGFQHNSGKFSDLNSRSMHDSTNRVYECNGNARSNRDYSNELPRQITERQSGHHLQGPSQSQGNWNSSYTQNGNQFQPGSNLNYTGNIKMDQFGSRNAQHQQNLKAGYGKPNDNVGRYQENLNGFQNVMEVPEASKNPNVGGLSQSDGSSPYKGTLEELDDFCKQKKMKEAVEVLRLLEEQHVPIDLPPLLQLMQACGEAKALEEAKAVHNHMMKSLSPLSISTCNMILEMYAKCGAIDVAFDMFNKMSERDFNSWDTMITWLCKSGLGEDAIDLFSEFKQAGLEPNAHLYIGVFSACSIVGDVNEGMLHFESMMKDYGIVPSMEHYTSIVDMLGSTGYLDEALEFIEKMPIEPSIEIWETLMMLSRIHGNKELGDRCAELVEALDPSQLNEQSKAGLVPVKDLDLVKGNEKKKLGSQNLLEVRSRVHEYRAGDTSHPENDRIYALLRGLRTQMKEAGYIAETRFVLHDIDQEGKEDALLAHSERLAAAYGFLTTPARSPVRVIKNLRVCGDCHNALKFISKIVGRELIMRDAKRFHHFKDGVCSCRDYW